MIYKHTTKMNNLRITRINIHIHILTLAAPIKTDEIRTTLKRVPQRVTQIHLLKKTK